MIRVALIGRSEGDWRPVRQEQWMAEVRRSPGLSALPRAHFDIEEDAYRAALDAWEPSGREAATRRLVDAGAVEVVAR